MTPIRVLLVDDHGIVREGLRQVLLADGDFDVVGEAANGVQALDIAARERPDVVLLDLTMPGDSGLVVAQKLRQEVPNSRVLILSVHDDAEYVLESVRAGAHGYLRKDTTPADLRAAIRAVHSGDAYFSPAVAKRLTEVLRSESSVPAPAPVVVPASLDALTNREREVLAAVARGLLNKEIAGQLGISVRTVEAHRDSVVRKLGIRSAAGLTRFAMEQGLLKGDGGAE
ncbi:MAG: response regulator transcription factor [Gemmatimonadetes bacterium]|jgi:DNA-binding NarL/FixJ family response regulator|nr:response regulator transcription factor [Gemmatimonadota bacterium]MBK8060719.1 response regulator transcription factor [Gemmatimonadota bacterium]MBK8649799.1 response regulator transcription factor [Gemmatimonadota bacterium]MBK9409906.1 response regulator transcription factor [Gemmatimonadota bacterium]MBK9977303.1 response regulator transcription factor [Gemmatimonadota bacterium]